MVCFIVEWASLLRAFSWVLGFKLSHGNALKLKKAVQTSPWHEGERGYWNQLTWVLSYFVRTRDRAHG